MTLTSTLGLACSVVGVRTSKEPGFRVKLAEGDKEIREYDSYLVARTEVRGDYETSGSQGFRRLFKYISGDNTGDQEISMTAPVLQEKEGIDIAMTAPVIQESNGETWKMDFVMPAHFTRETVPAPRDQLVVIEEVPAQTVAVIRYSGTVSTEDIAGKTRELEDCIAAKPYDIISRARSARYDPPFALPFLRRNEIHLTVEPRGSDLP